MGSAVDDMVRQACQAALNGDVALANEVIAQDDSVDRMEDEIILKSMSLAVMESPVAGDLRMLAATLGVVGEIEKAADHAVKLAGRSIRLKAAFPAELKLLLSELGELARHAFGSAMRLYAEYDDALAAAIIDGDEKIDEKYAAARANVVEMIVRTPESAEALVKSLDAIHTMEHVADQAVEIAQRLRIHNVSATPAAAESSLE
jgi:phosphate transport system protein